MTRNQNSSFDRRTFLKKTGQLGVLALASTSMRGFAIARSVTAEVPTTDGPVRGLIEDRIHTFLGVPYAAPPVGPLRFQPPRPPLPRKALLDTIRFGHSAMQLSTGGSAVSYPGVIGPALSQVFGSRGDILMQGEDCLKLNIWTPDLKQDDRPVMVWFHGGGYNYGSGSWPAYDGHNLALEHDVVVVTVNHRLNALGYLNLEEIGGEQYAHSGIVGQLDLVRCLEWVRDNIANFGGNPDNVTIFGQSGGGAKVSTLHGMPAAKGLFHKCIIQSGAGLTVGDPVAATETAEKVLRELDINRGQLRRLQNAHADDIVAAAARAGGRYGPILDRQHIPEHPFDAKTRPLSDNIPVMVGFTKDEMTLYNVGFDWWRNLTEDGLQERIKEQKGRQASALIEAYRKLHPDYSPRHLYTAILTSRHFLAASTLAERKAAQKSGNAYLYVFNHEAPVENGILRAPHTIEIPFVFNNVDKGPLLLGSTPATRKLGEMMSRVWVQFARTGNPNTRGIPRWSPYDTKDRTTMLLEDRSKAVDDYMGDIRPILRLRT